MAPRNGRSGRQPPRKRAASTSPTRSPKNQKRITSSKAEKSWQQHVPIKKVQSTTSNAAALRGSWRKHPRPQSARSGVPDLPEELLVMVFSYCDLDSKIQLAKTCKQYYRIGTEACFKSLSITLGRLKPCRTVEQFGTLLQNLKFTQHLQVRVLDVQQGTTKFKRLIERLKEVPLRSFCIAGPLDSTSYFRLQKALFDPLSGETFRSRLEKLDLPMRPPEDTRMQARNGQLDPSDGVYGCNALIRFKSSKQEKKNVTCEIGVVGRSDRVENDLVFGTPHRMLLRALKVLGFNPGHLEALLLFGENPGLGHQEYNNPLTHPPNNPLHLTELVLDHMELNRVSPTIFTSFVVSSLRKLRLKECTYLPSLLHHFISSGHTISITVLEIEVYDYKESAHESDSQGPLQQLKSFLTSFSTLHKFHLGIASMWPMDYIWRQLQSHKDLESCNIFVVGRGMNFWNVREMCIAHPMLKTLGHPVYNIRNALQGKQLPPDTVKDIRKLASEVVKSNQLEHWRLICEKPHVKVWSPDPYIHDGVHHHAAEALAKIMHQSCCQAAGSIGACRIRRISVSVITHRHMKKNVQVDMVPETFDFFFPSTSKLSQSFPTNAPLRNIDVVTPEILPIHDGLAGPSVPYPPNSDDVASS